MKTAQEFRAAFERDIANHELTIIRADGNDRHIRCARPGTNCQSFQILTFPGYLVYVGDMGAFTFWRTEDMFGFFRRLDGSINPGYWSEKLEAVCRTDGYQAFSTDLFCENVKRWARDQLELEEGAELPEDVLDELDSVLSAEDEHECSCMLREVQSKRLDFTDFWEVNNYLYTPRFLWCCHAIVWAINRFDAVTAEAAADRKDAE